ncbi:MAG: hypothetical protein Q8P41_14850 [Pseudomonadota bacterium]|nr:hypothetical protein [Pseudomonadota bacterium]
MPTTHDGISCTLRPDPLWIGIGLALLAGAAWFGYTGVYAAAAGLGVVGLLVLVNQKGSRRIRVIASKLVVEDERLLRNLLIGPKRSRIEWAKVRAVRIERGSLKLETDGAPFVTGQGASDEDLVGLKARVEAAIAKERAEA